MQTVLPFVMALSVGFTHAFEVDHLVAVSNIVTQRKSTWMALKDGVFWGLGHTSMILLIGSVFILGRFALHEGDFRYLETGVGVMLISLGVVRLYRLKYRPLISVAHAHGTGLPHHIHPDAHEHRLAYGVGLVHGLAGSGALVLSVLSQIKGAAPGVLYLLIFGVGSIAGMMVAAGACSVPFSARLAARPFVRNALVVASSVLCIGLGLNVLYENWVI